MSKIRSKLLLTISVIAFIYLLYHFIHIEQYTVGDTTPVISSIDGTAYSVHDNSQQAADMLARINQRMVDILRHLRNLKNLSMSQQDAVNQLLKKYNPDNYVENSPNDPNKETSYTIDKGSVVAICLRNRGAGNNDIQDIDILTFVTLHELTHIALTDIDHPPRFWAAFRFLLEEAEAAGVYTSADYARYPKQYCGIKVNYNPRYDANTKSLE